MRLRGKKSKLPKPLLVMKPDYVIQDDTKTKYLQVMGVIRHKYIFDKRPTPIITSLGSAKAR